MSPEAKAGLGAVAAGTLIALTGWVATDPHAQVPVLSEVVCSIKGESWMEGSAGLGTPAGCYRTPER